MIIVNMDMPKNCLHCKFNNECGECDAVGEFGIVDYKSAERPSKCPIICDIQQIRDEIDQKQYDFMSDGDYNEGIRFGLMLAYQIIDKYKGG